MYLWQENKKIIKKNFFNGVPKEHRRENKDIILRVGGVIPKCLMSKTGLDAQF